MNDPNPKPRSGGGLLTTRGQWALFGLVAVAAITFGVGLIVDPGRSWSNLLLNNFYFLSLSLIGVFFMALQALASAGWPALIRRVPEAMAGYLPVGSVLMLVLLLGTSHLFHWSHHDAVAHDPILSAKAGYLNLPGLIIRLVICLVLWLSFARCLVGESREQDEDGLIGHTATSFRCSAVFMVVFALSYTVASVDWLMSLEPHWFSTLFPWYVFSTVFVSGVALLTVLLILLRRRGHLAEVNIHHFHDLGKYVFAFSFFWGYLWYSQYMLIWYSNIPEEVTRFTLRESAAWRPLFLANLVGNLFLPFLLLLPAGVKRMESFLLVVCTLVVAGHWVDFYLMVFPAHSPAGPPFGWIEFAMGLGSLALFLLCFDQSFRQARPIPINDPYLPESLHHHL